MIAMDTTARRDPRSVVLYVRISGKNKRWVRNLARRNDVSDAAIIDEILRKVRLDSYTEKSRRNRKSAS